MALSEEAMGEGHPATFTRPSKPRETRRIELSEYAYGPDQPGLEVPIPHTLEDHDHGPDA